MVNLSRIISGTDDSLFHAGRQSTISGHVNIDRNGEEAIPFE